MPTVSRERGTGLDGDPGRGFQAARRRASSVDVRQLTIRMTERGSYRSLDAGCRSLECSAKVAERTPPLRAPREYTPRHLAEKILQSRSALEGERKQVTVVFADVKGSMELAEQLDPEAWSEIMQRFFRILSEGVGRFE